MKSILLIGLGRFGRHIAEELNKLGHEVMAVDENEDRVNAVLSIVTNAQIGDSTNAEFLEALGVRNFDVCIVAISGNFQSSLETTSLLKELGAKMVVSRAERDVQAKFLLRNGADEVLYPEKQLAKWAAIRNLITTTLKTQDYKYIAAATASEALQQATIHAPDVMLLDLGLPDLDGIEVIRRIRSWSAMPIIVISARSEDSDKIEALDSGADDYLTKPFSVEELLARLRVTFRRISMLQNASGCSVFTNGDLQIDFAAGCATLKGQELHLTPIEYRLLCVMAKNCGKVLTHTYITHEVWGSSWDNDVASLRVFMATLRKKLESEPDSPQYIQTHIGIGYRMLKV